MKKKNFYGLWVAALLMMAGGCSEELGEGNDIDTGGDGKGDKAYVTIKISSPTTKALTKANGSSNNPDGGEDGDGNAQGTSNENNINDVNIFLYRADGENNSDDNIGKADADIVGRGYSVLTDEENTPSHEGQHTAQATVEINIAKLGETVEYYNILTVTNAGEMPAFSTVAQLRDYLFEKKAWNDEDGNISNFVMSTHTMSLDGNHSVVGLSTNNDSPENAAEVNVYVERLAARIDLKLEEDYEVSSTNDNVVLTAVSVVNQLKAGSYLFKRVSPAVVGDNNTQKPSIPEAGEDIYLGDEKWYGTTGTGENNYVIDPWTRGKEGDLFKDKLISHTPVPLATHYTGNGEATTGSTSFDKLYINHFNEDLNNPDKTEFLEYKTLPVATVGDANGNYNPAGYRRIAYTLENTTDWLQQLNGFSTGVIFKGNYTPDEVTQYKSDKGGNEAIDYTSGGFYTNKVTTKEGDAATEITVLYADLKSLLVGSFGDGTNEDVIKYLFGGAESFASVTNKAVKEAVKNLTGEFGAAYRSFVTSALGEDAVDDDNVTANIDYTTFVNSLEEQNPGIETDAEVLAQNYDIHYYQDGTCYYKYWIRHANNGLNPPNNPNMGIMEYGIVRNNLYTLEVSAITKLGDPLPFTPGVDDPENPNEDDKSQYYIKVLIHVKDWVIRNNGNIEL